MGKARYKDALKFRIGGIGRATLWVLGNSSQLRLHSGEKAIRQSPAALPFVIGHDLIHITLNTGVELQIHRG